MSLPRGICFALIALAALGLSTAIGAQSPDANALKRADAAFHAGYAAQQAGQLDLARAKFAEAAKLAPYVPEAHQALGAVLLELEKPSEAAAELETALRLKRADPGIESDLAFAYAKAGEPAKAIPHFQSVYALAAQPGGPRVESAFCEAYARALASQDRQEDAIVLFRAAEERDSSRPDLDDAIGSLYAQLSEWSEARSAFERAIATDSRFVPSRIHLGILLRGQNDLPSSIAALSTAIELEPANAAAQLEYARSLAAAGRDEEALPHFERAAGLDHNLSGTQLELGMALQRLGRQQDAIPWFERTIDREPHNAGALTNLALALTLTGKAKEALPYFDRALKADPKNAVVEKDLGVAHLQLSAFDEAIADFQAALALDPNDPQLHYDLGLAYKFKDRMEDAVAELSRAGQMDPSLQDSPYTLGILYMQMGKLDDAAAELKKAVDLRPDNGDAWAILGSTLKQDSRLDEAREALEKAIPLLPGQPGPRVTLAGVLADQASAAASAADASEAAGDAQKAAQQREQAKELRAQAAEFRRQGAELARGAVNRQKAAFALNAGNQLLMSGQIADAVTRFQESIAADPNFSDAHAQLAVAYERQGRTAEAAAERQKATELAPAK